MEREDVIKLAVLYAAGDNANMPGHARRILKARFGVDILEVEAEATCRKLAGDALLALARLFKAA